MSTPGRKHNTADDPTIVTYKLTYFGCCDDSKSDAFFTLILFNYIQFLTAGCGSCSA